MTDYIDREAAIEALGEMPMNWTDSPEELQEVADWKEHLYAIMAVPAADVRPVVLCGDCVYMRPDMFGGILWCSYPKLNPNMVCRDFFCAYGKKKEDETDGTGSAGA